MWITSLFASQAAVGELGRRTLGVDYGLRWVGVAVSVGYAPRPVATLSHGQWKRPRRRRPNRVAAPVVTPEALERLIAELLQIARGERVQQIVVGLPLNSCGEETRQSRLTRAFAQQLADVSPVPIYLWDERYSSVRAAENLHANGIRRHEDMLDMLDVESAAVLLSDFFDCRGVRAELVPRRDTGAGDSSSESDAIADVE